MQPVIILVKTQLGENIGMCARAMLNCGLEELRLVQPRDGWPNEAAIATAADADTVLQRTVCFSSVKDAVSDCRRVLATSARERSLDLPVLSSDAAATEIRLAGERDQKVAILFGPEASGLDNDSISQAGAVIRFPVNPGFSSLNLAQAVLLFGWEWRRTCLTEPAISTTPTPAEKSELHAFLDRLENALDSAGFFLTPELRPGTVQNLRSFFSRAAPSDRELRLLQGMLTALQKTEPC